MEGGSVKGGSSHPETEGGGRNVAAFGFLSQQKYGNNTRINSSNGVQKILIILFDVF